MGVNHFLWTDERLIDAFKDIIEATIEVEDDYEDCEIKFNATRYNEFWEIRKEILGRMNR